MTPNSTSAAEIMLASTGRRMDVSESFIRPENYPNRLRSGEGGRAVRKPWTPAGLPTPLERRFSSLNSTLLRLPRRLASLGRYQGTLISTAAADVLARTVCVKRGRLET